ncbi:hypothetical protein Bbelb_370930 [Branchiostoma belcheri]|nr:hypothetical protein Bbelb_370930 [Branchiostoma belcheri]
MQQGPRQFNFELGERPRLRHTRPKLVSLFLAPSHFRPRPGHMVAEHSFRPMGISIVKDPKMTHFDAHNLHLADALIRLSTQPSRIFAVLRVVSFSAMRLAIGQDSGRS